MNIGEIQSSSHWSCWCWKVTGKCLLQSLILVGCKSLLVYSLKPSSFYCFGSQIHLPPCCLWHRWVRFNCKVRALTMLISTKYSLHLINYALKQYSIYSISDQITSCVNHLRLCQMLLAKVSALLLQELKTLRMDSMGLPLGLSTGLYWRYGWWWLLYWARLSPAAPAPQKAAFLLSGWHVGAAGVPITWVPHFSALAVLAGPDDDDGPAAWWDCISWLVLLSDVWWWEGFDSWVVVPFILVLNLKPSNLQERKSFFEGFYAWLIGILWGVRWFWFLKRRRKLDEQFDY